jgi:phosphate transport system substrate-binding protein
MAHRYLALVCMAVLTWGGSFGCSNAEEVTLQGSGATFPAPLYKRWFLEYYEQHSDTRANYSPIGSGAGIRQFTAGLVDFGASDAGISEKELAKLPPEYGGALVLPMTAGCIVLAYNVPGVNRPIRLSRAAYLKIFQREITSWNDEQIVKDNPGVELPDRAITVVTRADSSGTTYAFTSHMAAVSKALAVNWEPGVDKSVRWKESIAAQGNDGVAALIQLTPGAIGYIEFGYAHLGGLAMAALQNRSNQFVLPEADGHAGQIALEGADIPADLQIKVPDPQGAGAYPIVTYTWMLARRHYEEAREADALRALLRFCLDADRQQMAADLGYLRIPDDVVSKVLAKVDQLGTRS